VVVFHPMRCDLTCSLSSCGMVVVFWSLVRCCGLSKVWYVGQGYYLQGLWMVLAQIS
jgi:hypothetical protein